MVFQNFKIIYFIPIILLTFGFFSIAKAEIPETSSEIIKYFSYYTEGSNIKYTYKDWSTILASTVMRVGPSNRFKGRKAAPRTSSRIRLSNPKPSWLEGNRVVYDKLNEEHITSVNYYRMALESTPNVAPLASLSKNEQLAYWLNLYNVTVYSKMAQEYPLVKTISLWKKKFWDEKGLFVEAKNLSLNDIQNIVIANWDSPLVIYGLYQGSVGGPNIQNAAFTGENVWEKLNGSAKDFVNSIRGVQKKGKTLRVSQFYDRTRNAFPNFEEDLIKHISTFADKKTKAIVSATSKFKADYYDWSITDLHNGRPKAGRSVPISSGFSPEGMVGPGPELPYDVGGCGPSNCSGPNGISVAFMPSIHSASFLHNIEMKFKTPDFKTNFLFDVNDTKIIIDEIFPVITNSKVEGDAENRNN